LPEKAIETKILLDKSGGFNRVFRGLKIDKIAGSIYLIGSVYKIIIASVFFMSIMNVGQTNKLSLFLKNQEEYQ
jgi:hypothetical protein